MTETQADSLRYFAQSALGTAKTQAQNFLCFFLDECLDDIEVPKNGGAPKMLPSSAQTPTSNVANLIDFVLYPNPGSTNVTIELLGNSANKVQFFDLNGRLIIESAIDAQKSAFSVENLNSGIFVVVLKLNDEIVGRTKFIKR